MTSGAGTLPFGPFGPLCPQHLAKFLAQGRFLITFFFKSAPYFLFKPSTPPEREENMGQHKQQGARTHVGPKDRKEVPGARTVGKKSS